MLTTNIRNTDLVSKIQKRESGDETSQPQYAMYPLTVSYIYVWCSLGYDIILILYNIRGRSASELIDEANPLRNTLNTGANSFHCTARTGFYVSSSRLPLSQKKEMSQRCGVGMHPLASEFHPSGPIFICQ